MSALPLREQIFQQVDAALLALPNVASVRRMATGAATSYPDLVVDDGGEIILGQSVYGLQARLKLNIIGSVVQPDDVQGALDMGAETHRQMNVLDAAVRTALLSLAGPLIVQVSLGDLETRVVVAADVRSIDFSRTFYLDYNSLTLDASSVTDL